MKKGIHPDYKPGKAICSCGATFDLLSTKENISVEICSKCHPFYTGKQATGSKAGRIEKFNQKYGLSNQNENANEK